MGEVLAFVSGKGGTGKTSLCAAVAAMLGAMGKTVLCADLDVGLRNLDIPLGMTETAGIPFTDLLCGGYDFSAVPQSETLPGVSLLTAPVSIAPEEVEEDDFLAFLQKARDRYDFVLLDAPAGIGHLYRLAVRGCDRAVVVTAGDRATLRDGQKAAQLLEGKPAFLAVNRLSPRMFRKMRTTVDDLMDEVSLPLLGLVPEDKTVPLAAAAGRPLALCSRKGAARACLRMARRLCGLHEPLGKL